MVNKSAESSKIFITDGSDAVGYRVVKRLIDEGYSNTIRVGIPGIQECVDDSDAANMIEELSREVENVETLNFDWNNSTHDNDVAAYERALDGVTSVLCLLPTSINHCHWEEHFPIFLKACKKAGVKHFVKLSLYHARTSDEDFPLIRSHGQCDKWLAFSCSSEDGQDHAVHTMSYTIIGLTHLMSNPLIYQAHTLRQKKHGVFYGASGNHGINYVSPNDVSEVSTNILLQGPEEHHRNKEYTIAGPEAITDSHVATLLSNYFHKSITYVNQSIESFEDDEKKSGDPTSVVKDLVGLEKIKLAGKEEKQNFVKRCDYTKLCKGNKKIAESYEEYLNNTSTMTPKEKAL